MIYFRLPFSQFSCSHCSTQTLLQRTHEIAEKEDDLRTHDQLEIFNSIFKIQASAQFETVISVFSDTVQIYKIQPQKKNTSRSRMVGKLFRSYGFIVFARLKGLDVFNSQSLRLMRLLHWVFCCILRFVPFPYTLVSIKHEFFWAP